MRCVSSVALVWLAGCSAYEPGRQVQYQWDGSRVLCSKVIDDLTSHDGLTRIGVELEYAAAHDTAAMFHAHVPLSTISVAQLLCLFDQVDKTNVEMVTFSQFAVPSTPRPALALSFDDAEIDAWYQVRELFAASNAHVTFFVAGYSTWTDGQKARLAELKAMGHDVQAHSVYHLNAVDFVAEHGIDYYLQEEVLPSITALEQAGYPITTFAFPFGATTDEINDAVLEHVPQVRVTRSACPYPY
jgi:peptidoglycan/xylan/chitin deacetylase (PgdA/CDA1 family)